jgi:dephospho-CoA kinase
MLRVGLTGGLASGKSHVGRALAEMGCCLIQADDIGHQVLEPEGEAYRAVIEEFGCEILDQTHDETRKIDRRKLAALVFAQPERLEKLNALVHPPVRERIRKLTAEFLARAPDGIVVIEAAILIETGSYRSYDRLIVAVCGEEQQIERAMARDHVTREEALLRLSRQMPLRDKVMYADYVIDTSGTTENTLAQTREVYTALRSATGRHGVPAQEG